MYSVHFEKGARANIRSNKEMITDLTEIAQMRYVTSFDAINGTGGEGQLFTDESFLS